MCLGIVINMNNKSYYDESCKSCLSTLGKERISPGPSIYVGGHWIVEHAYPTQHKGWLVIVSKRHIKSIHELTHEEFEEFGSVLERTSKLLAQSIPSCERIYSMSLGEAPGFSHLHYHTIAVPYSLPPELRGAKIFSLLKEPEKAVPPKEIKEFCEYLKRKF